MAGGGRGDGVPGAVAAVGAGVVVAAAGGDGRDALRDRRARRPAHTKCACWRWSTAKPASRRSRRGASRERTEPPAAGARHRRRGHGRREARRRWPLDAAFSDPDGDVLRYAASSDGGAVEAWGLRRNAAAARDAPGRGDGDRHGDRPRGVVGERVVRGSGGRGAVAARQSGGAGGRRGGSDRGTQPAARFGRGGWLALGRGRRTRHGGRRRGGLRGVDRNGDDLGWRGRGRGSSSRCWTTTTSSRRGSASRSSWRSRRIRTWACRRTPGGRWAPCRRACANRTPEVRAELSRGWRACRWPGTRGPGAPVAPRSARRTAPNRCAPTTCWTCPGCARWTSAATRCANCRPDCSPTRRACARCGWTATACSRCRRPCSRASPACANCACPGIPGAPFALAPVTAADGRRAVGGWPGDGRSASAARRPRSPCAWR